MLSTLPNDINDVVSGLPSNGEPEWAFQHRLRIFNAGGLSLVAAVQTQLTAGRLMIVCLEGKAEPVPRIIADKIAERDASLVVRVKKTTTEIDADDPYAAFQIPDDFTW